MSDFSEAKDWLLMALIGGGAAYFGAQLKELVKAVTELNIKMSAMIENLANHKERIDEHSIRLVKLEDRA